MKTSLSQKSAWTELLNHLDSSVNYRFLPADRLVEARKTSGIFARLATLKKYEHRLDQHTTHKKWIQDDSLVVILRILSTLLANSTKNVYAHRISERNEKQCKERKHDPKSAPIVCTKYLSLR